MTGRHKKPAAKDEPAALLVIGMERLVEQPQNRDNPLNFNEEAMACRRVGQLEPIPRVLWDLPTPMYELTAADLERNLRDWLDTEYQGLPLSTEENSSATDGKTISTRSTKPQAKVQSPEAVNSQTEPADVSGQISRLRSQVGSLRGTLEDAFGDLLKGKETAGDSAANKKPTRKKVSFSDDQVEGKLKKTLAGIKASDLIKEPANSSMMIRRGPYLTRGADA